MTGSKAPGTIGGKWDEAEETAELTMADKKAREGVKRMMILI